MKAFLRILAVATFILVSSTGFAQLQGQKFAYVDTEYILKNIPEYNDAQEELNALSQKWEKEVKALYDKVEEMYKAYQTESVLLP
ncbi:MAG TPA: OmpH family outer membrane protein, partial [Bacteroidales bacterium]|nr:OmpH family outer membrane protein [Bacteroidales bacterium]